MWVMSDRAIDFIAAIAQHRIWSREGNAQQVAA
jgi:hypothetical protein